MDKVIVTKEDTLVGKVISLDGRLWRCCGKMGRTIHGNDGWLMQTLDWKGLRVEPEWIVDNAKGMP